MRKLKNSELGRLNLVDYKEMEKLPFVVILDNLRSQSNIGSVFRTSDAFKVSEILLCGITATPPNAEMQKTALGATDSVAWRYFENTTDAVMELKAKGFEVWAVEQADEKIDASDFNLPTKPLALIFGNEVKGVSDEVMQLVDKTIEIPQFGTKHSLNVSISAGIMIWEVFKKLAVSQGV